MFVLVLAAIVAYLVRNGTIDLDRDSDDHGDGTPSGVSGGDEPGGSGQPDDGSQGGGLAGADPLDQELLSDEEYVERLLKRNDGRMKQAAIVKETDWSNAKVSQLLSSMDEEGRVEKLRIGRENLISFPDEQVGELDGEE